jgi:hypothetical protein
LSVLLSTTTTCGTTTELYKDCKHANVSLAPLKFTRIAVVLLTPHNRIINCISCPSRHWVIRKSKNPNKINKIRKTHVNERQQSVYPFFILVYLDNINKIGIPNAGVRIDAFITPLTIYTNNIVTRILS